MNIAIVGTGYVGLVYGKCFTLGFIFRVINLTIFSLNYVV